MLDSFRAWLDRVAPGVVQKDWEPRVFGTTLADWFAKAWTGRLTAAELQAAKDRLDREAAKQGLTPAQIAEGHALLDRIAAANGGTAQQAQQSGWLGGLRIPGLLNDQDASAAEQATNWLLLLAVVGVVLFLVLFVFDKTR